MYWVWLDSIACILPTLEVNHLCSLLLQWQCYKATSCNDAVVQKASAFLGREALEFRRVHLCQKFATRTIQNCSIDTKMMQTSWVFSMDKVPLLQIKIKGHQNRLKFQLVHTRTGRYEESLVLYMTKILTSNLIFNSMWIVDYRWWRLLLLYV